jgi:hypothetical protein
MDTYTNRQDTLKKANSLLIIYYVAYISMQSVNLRQFVAMLTWKCPVIMIDPALTKLYVYLHVVLIMKLLVCTMTDQS